MKTRLYEWTDPETGEEFSCPVEFYEKLEGVLRTGRAHAQLAVKVVRKLGFPPTKSNLRHLRQAAMIRRLQGSLVMSYRSTQGGYYLANEADREVVEKSINLSRTLAHSMERNAGALENTFNKKYGKGEK